ncbi:NAD-dependent epimerase/dehydratase family protein [Sulfurimonas sp.]|uniref:NAD-dependent epimerase/dehydratase family protein n=1 Tax=Sulfurimonas sp. TaxID=2022749 RepID=UPI003D0FC25A
MSKKIVVTGATGFVGSHIVEYFMYNKAEGFELIPSCRDKTKLPNLYQEVTIQGNLKDQDTLTQITKDADVICHVASWVEMNGTIEDSQNNYLKPTIALIDKAIENGVERFIFLSAINSNPIEQNKLHTKLPLSEIWPHYDTIMQIEKYLKDVASKRMQVVILRVGFFTGKNYSLGVLPILLPRLKTHLVPWINNGTTSLPLINGVDIAQAFYLAATKPLSENFYTINVVGKHIPNVEEVLEYLYIKYNYPLPWYSVSFGFAYIVARFMRAIYKCTPFDPLLVPAIVLLLEETNANNDQAREILGYEPVVDWRDSIDMQIEEMQRKQTTNMRMNK